MIYVGDSAHSLHPIAGQSWNLGVRDIKNLLIIITKAKNDDSILELLNELLADLRKLNDLKKIESLEKDLINNLDENSYSELIKLKNQLNRE